MRSLLMVMSFFLLAFAPLSNTTAQAAEKSGGIYAVKFHADWCGSCQVIAPKLKKARGKGDLDNKNVLFVKLDLTDATSRHQSKLMANALGLGKFFKENNNKTGFILLVNAANGEMLGKITKEQSDADIAKMINEKLAAVN